MNHNAEPRMLVLRNGYRVILGVEACKDVWFASGSVGLAVIPPSGVGEPVPVERDSWDERPEDPLVQCAQIAAK